MRVVPAHVWHLLAHGLTSKLSPLVPCVSDRERWRYGFSCEKMESCSSGVGYGGHGKIDWSECSLVEVKAGVQSGAPVLRGTRMPVDAIVDNFDYGVSAVEIAEQFEIPAEQVEAILTYAKSHRIAHSV